MNARNNLASAAAAWMGRHPRVVIGMVLLLCLGPFLNKAVHMDDPLFIWSAERIQAHPADFFGMEVNWFGVSAPMSRENNNPPLGSYWLAAAASLFGWSEMALHGAFLAVAFAAAAGIFSLAKLWCERPLLAAVAACVSPVFLVSSTTLMCDVLMLAFLVWAFVVWEKALAADRMVWFLAAGGLAGCALLAKYSAVVFLPLLFLLGALRKRRLGAWMLGLAVPVILLAAYEIWTAKLYGRGLFFFAAEYASANRSWFEGGWAAKGFVGLSFAGGCLLPALFFAPFLWPRKNLLAGSLLAFGGSLGALFFLRHLGLMNLADGMWRWDLTVQMAFWMAAGLHLLVLSGVELWRCRDAVSTVLVLWIGGGFLFATVLNWTLNARSLLPVVPAVAILLARRLTRPAPDRRPREAAIPDGGDKTCCSTTAGAERSGRDWRLVWPLAAAAAVSFLVVAADFRLAGTARTAAREIAVKYKSAGGRLWFEGHWGFQYYLQKLGWQPVDFKRSLLQPGDIVVMPGNNSNVEMIPEEDGEIIGVMTFDPRFWLTTMHRRTGAGFHAADFGPLPFGFGRAPLEKYCVIKISRPLVLRSARALSRQAAREPVESPADASSRAECEAELREKPDDIATRVRLAMLLEKAGRSEAAIPHYREILRLQSVNVSALNNLALILATHPAAPIRNVEEALRLADRAVELTGRRDPVALGTLAVAYAEAGRFPEAIATAEAARDLAAANGQQDMVEIGEGFLKLFRAGKAVSDSKF